MTRMEFDRVNESPFCFALSSATGTMSFQRLTASASLFMARPSISTQWDQRWCPLTRFTPKSPARSMMSGISAKFSSKKVSWKVRLQKCPLALWTSSLTDRRNFTFSNTFSKFWPFMIDSWVLLEAPFQEILMSDVIGINLGAQVAAPSLGKVPLVVKFNFKPYWCPCSFKRLSSSWITARNFSKCSYRRGSPMVDGITSSPPNALECSRFCRWRSTNSLRTFSTSSKDIFLGLSPCFFRSAFTVEYWLKPSHMSQCKLQSSGFVSKVTRHGNRICCLTFEVLRRSIAPT